MDDIANKTPISNDSTKENIKKDEFQFELFKAIRDGDAEAFSKYYLGFADSLILFITKLIGDEEEAKEITQDVFAYLWENRSQIEPDKALNSFIYKVAKNMSYNVIRRRKIKYKFNDEQEHTPQKFNVSGHDLMISNETAFLIERTLNKMPPQRRKVFELSRYRGMTYKDIATEMNISTETVKAHMKLALKDMRDAITIFVILFLMR